MAASPGSRSTGPIAPTATSWLGFVPLGPWTPGQAYRSGGDMYAEATKGGVTGLSFYRPDRAYGDLFVRDYTITLDQWPSRMDWYLFAADLSTRVQSGRERLGE